MSIRKCASGDIRSGGGNGFSKAVTPFNFDPPQMVEHIGPEIFEDMKIISFEF